MFHTRTRLLAVVTPLLLTATLIATGCGESQDHAGHNHAGHDHAGHDHAEHDDHPSPKAKPTSAAKPAHDNHDNHDDHDHDHDHGDEGKQDDHDTVTLTPQAIDRWQVTLRQATPQPLSETFLVPARVSYNLETIAHVGSLNAGRVSVIHARVGDVVAQGEVLLEISSPELGLAQSDFLQQRAGIDAAQSALRIATTLHDSAKKLYEESRGIALSEVQKREADMLAADASLKAARNAVAAARNNLILAGMDDRAIDKLIQTNQIDPRAEVRSPLAGVVIEQSVAKGESVSADRDALFVIANMDTLWVLADVSENDVAKISKDSQTIISLPGSDQTLTGAVSYIAPHLDPATRTLAVRMNVKPTQVPLRPGQFVQVEIATSDQRPPVLAVPESAIQTVEGAPCVFVPVSGQPNTFAKRTVTPGPQVGRLIPIVSGLEAGESYVATGSFILKAELGKSGAGHEH